MKTNRGYLLIGADPNAVYDLTIRILQILFYHRRNHYNQYRCGRDSGTWKMK